MPPSTWSQHTPAREERKERRLIDWRQLRDGVVVRVTHTSRMDEEEKEKGKCERDKPRGKKLRRRRRKRRKMKNKRKSKEETSGDKVR